MTITRLEPIENLGLRAQIDSTGRIVGFIDRFGQQVMLAVTNASGQIGTPTGTNTAYRSDVLPVNSLAPAITGADAKIGTEQTCDSGTWTGSDNVYAYQWSIAGVAIPTAVTNKYTPVLGDLGLHLTCNVTATNPAGAVSHVSNSVTVLAAP